jgi:hypothetical protein
MPMLYETHCVSVMFLGRGKIRVNSDGFVTEGIWNCEELNQMLAGLTRQGWTLVSSVDRTPPHVRLEAMDLFFRKEVKSYGQHQLVGPEKNPAT